MKDCLFCQIVGKRIPSKIVLETDKVVVFPDIKPSAPIHFLIIPKKHLREFAALGPKEQDIWQAMIKAVHALIKQHQLDQKGYRLVTNGGGAQGINHFHLHLLGEIKKDRGI